MSGTVTDLLADYRAAAARQGAAVDSRVANRAAKEILASYRALRAIGEHTKIVSLLEDPDPSVRCWAGTHALEFAADRAEPVLELLANGPAGGIRASASASLREWRAGRLVFPT